MRSDKEKSSMIPDKPKSRRWARVTLALLLLGGLMAAGAFVYQERLSTLSMSSVPTLEKSVHAAENHQKHQDLEAPTAPEAGEESKTERKVLYYVDPMNPTMKSDKLGKAPCGMDLVPIDEEEKTASA